MKPNELASSIKHNSPPYIVDVRSAFEFRSGKIPGAVNLPLWKIPFSQNVLPGDFKQNIVVTCEHGPRAIIAVLLLRGRGYRCCQQLEGHMAAWRRLGLPVEKS